MGEWHTARTDTFYTISQAAAHTSASHSMGPPCYSNAPIYKIRSSGMDPTMPWFLQKLCLASIELKEDGIRVNSGHIMCSYSWRALSGLLLGVSTSFPSEPWRLKWERSVLATLRGSDCVHVHLQLAYVVETVHIIAR